MSVERESIRVLIKSHKSAVNDEFTRLVVGENAALSAAVNDLIAGQQAESTRANAKIIVGVLTEAKNELGNLVDQIRSLRRQEKIVKEKIEAVERAQAYGLETNNFLPLAVMLSHDSASYFTDEVDNADVLKVPANWVPKAEKPAKKAKGADPVVDTSTAE